MSENKLLSRLETYLGLDTKKRKEKAGELEKVIKKLKKKEKELIVECGTIVDDEQQHSILEKRINVLHAQRKKGLKALKKINKE